MGKKIAKATHATFGNWQSWKSEEQLTGDGVQSPREIYRTEDLPDMNWVFPELFTIRFPWIGDEAKRAFVEEEREEVMRLWKEGRRTESRRWKWIEGYGVTECFIFERPGRNTWNHGRGMQLWMFKRIIDGKLQYYLATPNDVIDTLLSAWKGKD